MLTTGRTARLSVVDGMTRILYDDIAIQPKEVMLVGAL
jgi:hypothetical protein